MIYLTGFVDEVDDDLRTQVDTARELGWSSIELRTVGAGNVDALDAAAFESLEAILLESDLGVSSFGSTIANWGRGLEADPAEDLEALRRCAPRMHRLGARFLRVMSYRSPAPEPADGPVGAEVVRRLRDLAAAAEDEGIVLVHENCETWGGQSVDHTRRLLDSIPSDSFALVYDTGNPVGSIDLRGEPPYGYQDPLAFLRDVRDRVAYVHIKDCRRNEQGVEYVMAGEGDARIPEILNFLAETDYEGPISIEPHMGDVFHDPSKRAEAGYRRTVFLDYARTTRRLLEAAGFTV